MLIASYVVAVSLLGPSATGNGFYGSWLQTEVVTAGKSDTNINNLEGHEFTPRGWTNWARSGEISPKTDPPGPRVDTRTHPSRVDLRAFGSGNTPGSRTLYVRPAIYKLEDGGKRMTLAFDAQWVGTESRPPGKDYPSRPKDFVSTPHQRRGRVAPEAVQVPRPRLILSSDC